MSTLLGGTFNPCLPSGILRILISPFPLFSDIFDEEVDWEQPCDIYALGFEEMVDLNASNIMSARYVVHPSFAHFWETGAFV